MLKLKNLYMKYQAPVLYVFFGGLTTLINMAVYAVGCLYFAMDPLLSNVAAWIAAVLFAYLSNRRLVFHSDRRGLLACLPELIGFYAGRLLTLGIEEGLLYIFILQLYFDAMWVKLCAQILVMVGNYLISKFLVFRHRQRSQ